MYNRDLPIRWSHICLLHKIQPEKGLQLANEVRTRHITFKQHVMNVKVAAPTIGSSIADAIECLMKAGVCGLEDAAGTVEFIRKVDCIVDFLNSSWAVSYKKPISWRSLNYWTAIMEGTVEYFKHLTDSLANLMIHHGRRTFLCGFILTSLAVLRIAQNLLMKPSEPFPYVELYRFSQDDLFGCFRQKGGHNNNPDALQFRASLRKLLMKSD